MKQIGADAEKKAGADAFGTFVIPPSLRQIILVGKEEDGTKIFESYPGIIFLWSIKKVTRA